MKPDANRSRRKNRIVAKVIRRKGRRAMIIGVLNQKGGVGKTTIAINIAAVFATDTKNRVLLVDADPQGSSMAWSAARESDPLFPVIGMAKPTLHKDLPELARDYDMVVIDGAPRVNELGRAAIMAADLVLIPVQPSPYDVWATTDIVGLVNEARTFKDRPEALMVSRSARSRSISVLFTPRAPPTGWPLPKQRP
jgi:chromosome partitioning protein